MRHKGEGGSTANVRFGSKADVRRGAGPCAASSTNPQTLQGNRERRAKFAEPFCLRFAVTVQRCNGFEHYRRSRLLAKARRGGARSGRANGGGPHQVAHAWYRRKLRKDRQMGRATSRRTPLSERSWTRTKRLLKLLATGGGCKQ